MKKLRDGKLTAAIGASRSGKTQYVLDQIRGRKRVMIWDVEEQYTEEALGCQVHRAHSQKQLIHLVKTLRHYAGVIAFTGKLDDYDFFCKAAFSWVKTGKSAGVYSCVVLEETADVTSPGKAPEGHGILIRRGLKYACDIFAITQRPAESDKTTVGNASIIHCCRVGLPRDVKYMSEFLDVPQETIKGLVADRKAGRFEYVHRDLEEQKMHMGELTFSNDKPNFKAIKPL